MEATEKTSVANTIVEKESSGSRWLERKPSRMRTEKEESKKRIRLEAPV